MVRVRGSHTRVAERAEYGKPRTREGFGTGIDDLTERDRDRPGERSRPRGARSDEDEDSHAERGSTGAGGVPPDVALAAFEAAIEALGVPAFLLDATGSVVAANRAGHGARDRDLAAYEAAVARAIAGEADGILEVTAVRGARREAWWLAVQRAPRVSVEERARAATRRWHLTPRQAQVAAEVARGRPNRDIARALGCAESTVELHVTALLGKSQCQGRAELVARFWTDP